MAIIARAWATGEELSSTASEYPRAVEVATDLGGAFAQCADALYRFILVRVGGDREAASDLLQDCCYHAARHRWPPTDPNFLPAWFGGIARNLIRRHWRRSRRARRERSIHDANVEQVVASRLALEPLPPDAVVSDETMRELMIAVSALSRPDQELILAFYFEEQSAADIAAGLRLNPKTAETRLRRARERLKKILVRTDGDGGQ